MKTNAEIYFEEQMKDPEYRALYALTREKTHIKFMLELLIEDINKDIDKKKIVRQARKIVNQVSKIGLL